MKKILALSALIVTHSAEAMESYCRSECGFNSHKQTFLTYKIDKISRAPEQWVENAPVDTIITVIDHGDNFTESAAIASPKRTETDKKKFEEARTLMLKELLPNCGLYSTQVISDENYPSPTYHLHEALKTALFSCGGKPDFISMPLEITNYRFCCTMGGAKEWYADFDKLSEVFLKAKKNNIGIILSAGHEGVNIFVAYPKMRELLLKMKGYLFLVYGLYTGENGFMPKTTNFCKDRYYQDGYLKYGICAPMDLFSDGDDYWGSHLSVGYVTAAAVFLKTQHPTLKANEIFSILNQSATHKGIELIKENQNHADTCRSQPLGSHIRTLDHLPGLIDLDAAESLAKAKHQAKL